MNIPCKNISKRHKIVLFKNCEARFNFYRAKLWAYVCIVVGSFPHEVHLCGKPLRKITDANLYCNERDRVNHTKKNESCTLFLPSRRPHKSHITIQLIIYIQYIFMILNIYMYDI